MKEPPAPTTDIFVVKGKAMRGKFIKWEWCVFLDQWVPQAQFQKNTPPIWCSVASDTGEQ